jgi:hypothetical protein
MAVTKNGMHLGLAALELVGFIVFVVFSALFIKPPTMYYYVVGIIYFVSNAAHKVTLSLNKNGLDISTQAPK